MAPSRTGTESQVDGSAGSGSTSVTVPADATGAVAFWAFFLAGAGNNMSSLALGASNFAIQSQRNVGAGGTDSPCTGVATLYPLPGTGTQTFAWTYSTAGARTEGGELVVVWVKNFDTADMVGDAKSDSIIGTASPSITVTAAATDLVLALDQAFGANPADPGGSPVMVIDGAVVNSEVYDLVEYTLVSPSVTITFSGSYATTAGVAIQAATAVAGVSNRFLTRHSRMTSW